MGSKSGPKWGQNRVKNGVILGPSGGSKKGPFWGRPGGPPGGRFPALPGAENPPPGTPENPPIAVSNANICPDWESY